MDTQIMSLVDDFLAHKQYPSDLKARFRQDFEEFVDYLKSQGYNLCV